MEKIRGFFLQKAGPLPVWIWAAIVLAAVLGYMYWKKTGIFAASAASANPADPSAGSGSGLVDPTSGLGGGGLGAGGGPATDLSNSAVAPGGGVTAGPGYYSPAASPYPDIVAANTSPLAVVASGQPAAPRQVIYPAASFNEVGQQISNPISFNPIRPRSSGNQALI